jgi:hypothetical protein
MAKITKTLPIGTAVFPKLDKVDVYQPTNPKTGKPTGEPKRTWNTRVKFSDEDHREVDAWVKKLAKDAGLQNPQNMPFKKDKKTGDLSLMVSSGEEYKPGLYDSKNKPLPEGTVIGGGSQIRVNVSPFVYEGVGGGVKLYLNAVQVIKLERGGGNGVSPFDEEDGGYEAKDEPKSPFDPDAAEDAEDEQAF